MSMQGKVVVITGSNIGHRARDGRRGGGPGGHHRAGLSQPGQGRGGGQGGDPGGPGTTTCTWCRSTWPTWPRSARRPTRSCSRWDRLDVLVNNAGGTWSQRQVTAQGFEYTIGVNHLGPLLPDEPAARPPTRRRPVPRRQRHLGRPPRRLQGHALRRPAERAAATTAWRSTAGPSWPTSSSPASWRAARRRAAVTANTAHPGWVRSRFGMDGDLTGIMGFGIRVMRPFQISPTARRQDLGLPGHVARRRDEDGHVLGPLQAGSHEPARPRRRGGRAPVGRERAAARLGRVRRVG